MARCLVTGGAGFIGSHLVDRLVRLGHRVRVLDDLSTGRAANLAGSLRKLEVIEADIRDLSSVERAVKGVRYVFHLAAAGSVQRSIDDPLRTNEINVTGTLNVLTACRDARVRRVVFSSSSSVYGGTAGTACAETATPNPLSPYAATKVMGEYYCRLFHRIYGLQTVVLRYFNVFGPRQRPDSQYAAVIPRFIDAVTSGRPPVIYGDGLQTRDFTCVEDVVAANVKAATHPKAPGETFNIAPGRPRSVIDVLLEIEMVLDHASSVKVFKYKPARPGDIRNSRADARKAKRILGYAARTPFSEGIRHTVAWFSKSGLT